MEELKKSVFALVAAAVSVWTFLVPDAPGFASPEFARIFFWHFPCPIMLTGLIFAGVWFSYRYFAGPSPRLVRIADSVPAGPPRNLFRILSGVDIKDRAEWDLRAVAAIELGWVFTVLTMFSGILFSRIEWGQWWSWDPRQTSFLIGMLFYAAYFAVRAAFPDPEKRAANSAAYLMATLLPQLFLIYVYPRIQESLHPSNTIMSGQLHGGYLYAMLAMMAVVGVLTVWLYRLRVRAGLLLLRDSDERFESLENTGRPARGRVVARPVPVSAEGGANREGGGEGRALNDG